MSIGIVTAAYIAASVLFILALGGLSNQEKAKRAVWFGIIGMGIAVLPRSLGLMLADLVLCVVNPIVGCRCICGCRCCKTC